MAASCESLPASLRKRALIQALIYGHPSLLLRAGYCTAWDILNRLPETSASITDAMIYDAILRRLPINQQHRGNSQHFLISHSDRKYAVVAMMALRHSMCGNMASDLQDPSSPTLQALITSRLTINAQEDPSVTMAALRANLHVLTNEMSDDLLIWVARTVSDTKTVITGTVDVVDRWVNAVVSSDCYNALPCLRVVTSKGVTDDKFSADEYLRRALPLLLERWQQLRRQAPDYLKILTDSAYSMMNYYYRCNGFHSINSTAAALLYDLWPKLLPSNWCTLTPIARGLSSLTAKALLSFAGFTQHHHYNHKLFRERLVTLMANTDPQSWFLKYHRHSHQELSFAGEICNDENTLGNRIDDYSKSDYISSYNTDGTHCYRFTREEFPVLLRKSRNFYTNESLSQSLIDDINRIIIWCDEEWLLPSRPWLENWLALQNGQWLSHGKRCLAGVWQSLDNWTPRCITCKQRHVAYARPFDQQPLFQEVMSAVHPEDANRTTITRSASTTAIGRNRRSSSLRYYSTTANDNRNDYVYDMLRTVVVNFDTASSSDATDGEESS